MRWQILLLLFLALVFGCGQSTETAPSAARPDGAVPMDFVQPDEVEASRADDHFGGYRKISFENEAYHQLIYDLHGAEVMVIDTTAEMCLWPEVARDFDGNGLEDLLVRHAVACGGNCCGDAFFFVSQVDEGRFVLTREEGWVWDDPVIEQWKGQWSFTITSNNMGFGTDPYEEKTERFVLEGADMRRVELIERHEAETVALMRSSEFEDEEETRTLAFDLDEDGKLDQISATLWARWGQLVPTITMSDGTEIKHGVGGRRIGVSAHMTNGMHDLVGDLDDIYIWDGKAYSLR